MANFDIVPTHLAIAAMRDSGYKNAAYAIAELVDNAIQATASHVEIICKEEEVFRGQRNRKNVKEIAVIDNGTGMSRETLRKALQFGNGERLQDRTGIGRFGMGLPNSSISQAKRVSVWTWMDGIQSALYSYLDLAEIQRGDMREVPEPIERDIPHEWGAVSASILTGKSGTLIVWSDLDKCDWRTAHAIFRNSEYTIGRIYRYFLTDGKVRIRMAAFMDDVSSCHMNDYVQPNDPLYLISNTSTPGEWGSKPMFEQYGEPKVIAWGDHCVTVRISVAKNEVRDGFNTGSTPHGQHAKNNVGVSVIRADRELELQVSGWTNSYDPRERWWGVEVNFPPALDEIFGVTNNKQSARSLAEFASVGLDQIAEREGFDSEHALIEAWKKDGDPRFVLVEVKQNIESNLSAIRRRIKALGAGGRSRYKRVDPDSAEARGTEATRRRREEEGISGQSDRDEGRPVAEREKDIVSGLQEDGLDVEDAKNLATTAISDGRKYEFYEADLPTAEFFTVRPKGGVILIGLNTSHPAYDHLVTLLKDSDEDKSLEDLRIRVKKSYEGLKLLLEAWARYEDELTDGVRKQRAQDARIQWGMVAREFFRED